MESPKESFKKRYQIIKRISEGNFGCVYKALDTKTSFLYKSDEFVALKKLFVATRNQKQRSIVEREIEILKKHNHPNVPIFIQIIRLLNYKLKATSITIVLEYCEYDLLTFISMVAYPLPPNLTRSIAYQLLLGLEVLHKSKILHRDLKPSNILLNDQVHLLNTCLTRGFLK